MSQRMAGNVLREEMVAVGEVRAKDGEAAMAEVITAIRQLERMGELVLKVAEES